MSYTKGKGHSVSNVSGLQVSQGPSSDWETPENLGWVRGPTPWVSFREEGFSDLRTFLACQSVEVCTITEADILKIYDKYWFRDTYHLHLLGSEYQITFNPINQLAIYKEDLHADLQFLLHPFILNILDLYKVVPTYLTLNSFCILVFFIILATFMKFSLEYLYFRPFSYWRGILRWKAGGSLILTMGMQFFVSCHLPFTSRRTGSFLLLLTNPRE